MSNSICARHVTRRWRSGPARSRCWKRSRRPARSRRRPVRSDVVPPSVAPGRRNQPLPHPTGGAHGVRRSARRRGGAHADRRVAGAPLSGPQAADRRRRRQGARVVAALGSRAQFREIARRRSRLGPPDHPSPGRTHASNSLAPTWPERERRLRAASCRRGAPSSRSRRPCRSRCAALSAVTSISERSTQFARCARGRARCPRTQCSSKLARRRRAAARSAARCG